MLRRGHFLIPRRTCDSHGAEVRLVIGGVLAGLLALQVWAAGGELTSAPPIPPPPQSRSLLPPALSNVVMIRVVDGRLNVPLGGWGGQRLIQVKTDPEKFRACLRAVKQRGLNCVRPLFHPPDAAKANDAEWAPFDWEAMDRAVAMTQEEGLYFLVDYHNWLVNDTIHVHQKEWLRTWAWVMSRYKDYHHLIFEGFNEPQNQCACLAEHYQRWVDQARSLGSPQLCVVSPFWGAFFGINDPAGNWAQCRHYYFNSRNSPSSEKARAEAEWQVANLSNRNSAASTVARFHCGFFMTEGGIEGRPRSESEKTAQLAGVQRVVELCEEHGYGWCLWAQGDWADGFETYGARIRTRMRYPLITGSAQAGSAPLHVRLLKAAAQPPEKAGR